MSHRWLIVVALLAGCTGQRALAPADYRALLPSLQERAAEAPHDASAFRDLGVAYAQAGDPERAYEALLEAERLDPGDPKTYYAVGLVEEELGNLDEAIARYQDANRGSPYWQEMTARAERLARQIAQTDLATVLAAEDYPEAAYAQGDVAVFPFASEEGGALGRGLSEVLARDLADVGGLRVVSGVRAQLLLEEYNLAPGDLDAARAQRLGRLLQVRWVVSGSVEAADSVRIRAVLIPSAPSSEVGASSLTAVATPADEVFEGIGEVAARLLGELGVSLTEAEQSRLGRAPTTNAEAFLLYGRGLLAMDAGRYAEAASLYTEAFDLDPRFRLAAEQARVTEPLAATADAPAAALLVLGIADAMVGAEGLVSDRLDALNRSLSALVIPGAGARDPAAEVTPSGPATDPFPDPPPPPRGN